MRLIQSVKERIMKNGLPEGYTRLEYLQSTGVQYIDTGISAKTGLTVESRVKYTTTTGILCGAITTSAGNGDRFYAINFSQSGKVAFTYLDSAFSASTTLTNGSIYTIKTVIGTTKQELFVDGVSKGSTSKTDIVDLNWTLGLFALHRGTEFTPEWFSEVSMIVYNFKIWDNNALVRDFVPALDPSDKPCMYDLVSKQPFYNLGTGADFSIGKKLTPVEYLESTGTQYIDTGMGFDANTTTKCKFAFVDQTITSAKHLIGAMSSNIDARYNPIYCTSVSDVKKIRTLLNIDGSANITRDFDTNTHTIEFNTYPDKKVIYDGVFEDTVESIGTSNVTINLFRRNYSGGYGYANARMYYCQFYKQGELVRDFIPVRDENNVGYMLDLLTNTLYANAGSGSFAIGEDDLVIRNIGKTKFFKQTTRKIPKGFQEVEYLASDGNQYIDAEVLGNGEFDVDYMYYQTQDQSNAIFAGTRSASQHLNFGQRSNGSTGAFSMAYLGEYWQSISSPAINTNVRVQISYKNGSQTGTLNGTVMTSKSLTGTEATNLSIYIFKRNHYSTDNVTGLVGRIYYFKLWNNGALVRDFVPYLDASGRPCMWDRVEGKPYYNQGTGEFSYGRKIIPVEYLESTGTQYIDTGFKGKNNIDFDYKVNFTNVTTSSGYGIGGEWENNKSLYLGLIRSNGNFAYHYANTNAPVVVLNSVSADTDYSIQGHMWSGEQYMVINSTKSAVGTITGTFESTQNIALFRVTSSSPIYCYAKIYYLKIWDNNTLVRDFIPCIDENNVPYMFDRVTHSAFLNAGTGNFLYGNPVGQRTETLRVLPIIRHLPLNYLEATGTQYIDTGLLSTADSKVDGTFGFTSMESGVANNVGVFGGRNGQQSTTFTLFKIASGTPQYFRFDFNGQPQVATANQMTWNATSKYRFEYDGTKYTTTNTTTSQSVTSSLSPSSTFTTSSICLFAVNTNGTIGQYLSGRIYHYWYTDGTNTIDLYPVLKLPERVPCMYDRVSKTYFYNESTDPFLYG